MSDLATIYLTASDQQHEAIVGKAIQDAWPNVELFPTPKFFPFDFHVMRRYRRGSSDYLGGLEVKWFNHASDRAGVFNYNKLLQLLAMTVHRDDPGCHHRIAFRFTDGILISAAQSVASQPAQIFTRKDTNETDLVVRIGRDRVPGTWLDVTT
jgi:hypothetical protein